MYKNCECCNFPLCNDIPRVYYPHMAQRLQMAQRVVIIGGPPQIVIQQEIRGLPVVIRGLPVVIRQ